MKKQKKRGPVPEIWTAENIAKLKKMYATSSTQEVAAHFGLTESAIRNAAVKYKAKKSTRYWDKPDHDYLLKNWDVMSAQEIGDKLKKTKWAVINKYRELKGLR